MATGIGSAVLGYKLLNKIKISPELAQIYRQASTETQAQIQSKITALLESQIMSYHQEK